LVPTHVRAQDAYQEANDAAEQVAQAARDLAKVAEEAENAYRRSLYWTDGSWRVSRDAGYCRLQGPRFTLAFDHRRSRATLSFAAPAVQSLRQDQLVLVKVALIDRNPLRGVWLHTQHPLTADVQTGLTFLSGKFDADLLDHVAKHHMISFSPSSDRNIASFWLNGSAVAVSHLKRCALEEGAKVPIDPFAD
jgi:hypothetical protein